MMINCSLGIHTLPFYSFFFFCSKNWIIMQLKVRRAERHRCKDTVRSEKTGILYMAYSLICQIYNKQCFCFSFFAPYVPVSWRFRSKRKVGTTSSASLDFYLNHQIGNRAPNENSGKSGACSPTPIKPPSMTNCVEN